MGRSHLDCWLAGRMGRDATPTRPELRAWLLERLRELVDHARRGSPFYARHFADVSGADISSLEDFARLPEISPELLQTTPDALLSVSRSEIERVVTLSSSGTTGEPKRIFHTAADLEATVDFFGWGMANMVEPGGTALVLLPGERPGGVGRLLGEALARHGSRVVAIGELTDAGAAVERCLAEKAACVVGSPAHVNLLAHAWAARGLPKGGIRSALLCWDVIPDAVRASVAERLGCRVFRHWGMIETGLGGAVECAPGSGMHLRETDVFVEIVDPRTGALLPDGEFGDMVVTTPLKMGMPIIRYRTGDVGRILPGACGCGSPLRRLDPLVRRRRDGVTLASGSLTLRELNEILYGLPGVADFAARLEGDTLRVTVCGSEPADAVLAALKGAPAVAGGLVQGTLKVDIENRHDAAPAVPGLAKRRITTGVA
ncbi:AMP-dependent synthetase and ligase [Pseudodesulfovibrio mercurii]|uniref:AMP-dependent synthetase and ligase n=1 Tax=Pseudodesulfovibrio mercurii TaxID=641491 RepID=F0JDJ6_9BACT|nr:AMP-binding protein [Pseudodesulfovibrio mercurii]EGB13365.1 AMP-dependent synthetase and ligase [Pseudodesulfovibrio mercurii]